MNVYQLSFFYTEPTPKQSPSLRFLTSSSLLLPPSGTPLLDVTLKFLQVLTLGSLICLCCLPPRSYSFTWLDVIIKVTIITYFVKPLTSTTETHLSITSLVPHKTLNSWKMKKMRFKEVKQVFSGVIIQVVEGDQKYSLGPSHRLLTERAAHLVWF